MQERFDDIGDPEKFRSETSIVYPSIAARRQRPSFEQCFVPRTSARACTYRSDKIGTLRDASAITASADSPTLSYRRHTDNAVLSLAGACLTFYRPRQSKRCAKARSCSSAVTARIFAAIPCRCQQADTMCIVEFRTMCPHGSNNDEWP